MVFPAPMADAAMLYLFCGLVCLTGALSTSLLLRIGRRHVTMVSLLAGSLACAAIAWLSAYGLLGSLLAPSIGSLLMVTSRGAADALALESVRQMQATRPRHLEMVVAIGFHTLVQAMSPSPLASLQLYLVFQLCCSLLGIAVARSVPNAPWIGGRLTLMSVFLVPGTLAVLQLAATMRGDSLEAGLAGNWSSLKLAALLGQLLPPLLLLGMVPALLIRRIKTEHARRSSIDQRTGVANRPFLLSHADEWFDLRRRESRGAALMLIEFDDLALIDQSHGPLIGDRILRHVASVLQRSLRRDSLIARYGSDEFCALVPVADEAEAWQVADRLRRAVATEPWMEEGQSIDVTVTIGVSMNQAGRPLAQMIQEAEQHIVQRRGQSGQPSRWQPSLWSDTQLNELGRPSAGSGASSGTGHGAGQDRSTSIES